ncbi:MAG: DoxX family protein [Planctomycetaceae bacterium]|nr:DoxX family protein [Planctomycetaceae bacterium]
MTDTDFRKISIMAVIFLVILRMSIGWQMLYEGLWKFQTLNTSSPWTAEPYLKNAQGPFRNYYRGLTGDPNDLRYMDYETVSARWSDWASRFAAHYGLNENQQRALNTMVHGPAEFRRGLAELPAGVRLEKDGKRGIHYDAEKKQLVVDGKLHMTPREKQDVLAQVNFDEASDSLADIEDPVVRKFVEEVQKIYDQQAKLSYLEKALGILRGNPEFATVVDASQKGTHDETRLGKIQIYRDRLNRYEAKLARATTQFDWDHLDYDWKEIQQMRSEIVGPIRGLEKDMEWQAEKLLGTDQLARGPLPAVLTEQRKIDLQTMYALTIIGSLLIAGLFTRLAAFAGAILLLNFYLAYPPFPGFAHPPGTEHSLFMNKLLIEVLMLTMLVFLPTGRWFGIDAMFSSLFRKRKPDDRH